MSKSIWIFRRALRCVRGEGDWGQIVILRVSVFHLDDVCALFLMFQMIVRLVELKAERDIERQKEPPYWITSNICSSANSNRIYRLYEMLLYLFYFGIYSSISVYIFRHKLTFVRFVYDFTATDINGFCTSFQFIFFFSHLVSSRTSHAHCCTDRWHTFCCACVQRISQLISITHS